LCVIEFAQVHSDWQARAMMKVFHNFGISLLLPIGSKLGRLYCILCSIFETRFPTRTIVYGTCNFSSLLNSVVKYVNITSVRRLSRETSQRTSREISRMTSMESSRRASRKILRRWSFGIVGRAQLQFVGMVNERLKI